MSELSIRKEISIARPVDEANCASLGYFDEAAWQISGRGNRRKPKCTITLLRRPHLIAPCSQNADQVVESLNRYDDGLHEGAVQSNSSLLKGRAQSVNSYASQSRSENEADHLEVK